MAPAYTSPLEDFDRPLDRRNSTTVTTFMYKERVQCLFLRENSGKISLFLALGGTLALSCLGRPLSTPPHAFYICQPPAKREIFNCTQQKAKKWTHCKPTFNNTVLHSNLLPRWFLTGQSLETPCVRQRRLIARKSNLAWAVERLGKKAGTTYLVRDAQQNALKLSPLEQKKKPTSSNVV